MKRLTLFLFITNLYLFISCSGKNDQIVKEIENTKDEMKLLDDFSKDSRSQYVTNTTSNTFSLPDANWRFSNKKLYPAPIDKEKQWYNNSVTKRNAIIYRKNEFLLPGKAVSIDVFFTKDAWKYPELGLMVEKSKFTINPSEAGYTFRLNDKEYNLDAPLEVARTIHISLLRGKDDKSNIIFWYANGIDISKRGECEIKDLPVNAHFGLYFNMCYKETQKDYNFSNLQYGDKDIKDMPNTPIAELTMNDKLPPVYSNKTVLNLDETTSILTQKELDNLIDWAINEPGQYSNLGNRMLNTHTDLYKVYRIYKKTKDIRILNNLVEIGYKALSSRNDNNKIIGKYKTLSGLKNNRWTFDYALTWPHFMGWEEQDGEKYYFGDVGEDAVGVNYMATAALAIAETPEIWSTKMEDKTYKEIAMEFVDESIKTIEQSIIPKYIDPLTSESIYQYQRYTPHTKTLDLGGYIPFNRFWHVIVAFISLNPAMELLNINRDKVLAYDKISVTSINRWLSSMEHTTKNGYQILDYPYCYPSQKIYNDNPSKWNFLTKDFNGFPSEDLNHLGCDASQLYIFYFSKRYLIPDNILKEYANALLLLDSQKNNNYFPYRLCGTGSGGSKTLSPNAYFFSLFQPQLKDVYKNNSSQNKKEISREELFLKLLK